MPNTVILSGGTATNDLVATFTESFAHVDYILPISDNGGSSLEIIRVIGGPAVGDIRSRLTRLIPDHQASLRKLLSFRLDTEPDAARRQWNELVEGTHPLWATLPLSTKEIVRSFLVHVHVELLKRSRISGVPGAAAASGVVGPNVNRSFCFELANVGNLFLSAARLFIGSLDSAIELFTKITDIPASVGVLPCINTNFTYHIGAILANGSVITGQSQISHPSAANDKYQPPIHEMLLLTPFPASGTHTSPKDSDLDLSLLSEDELGNVPLYTHPELKKSQLHFVKPDHIEPLNAPVSRVFYISPYGEEICPAAQTRVTSAIANTDILIYSIGSLMTSIVPIVILKGVGRAIAHQHTQSKKLILLLNCCEDRETYGLTAYDYVRVICELAQYSLVKSGHKRIKEWHRFVTHVFYMENPKIAVDVDRLLGLGIECVQVKRQAENVDQFDSADLCKQLKLMVSAAAKDAE
ncbi:UPF0052-domain-containing protein [Metschnikowia bicuspidata]|uniref:UPF0052-domain-containing protein n=1 Tax=Metschnikowia bicuspidata TaxID=27322 RepID=A0A4P9ZFI5_9ASCO|nr:UPF0052-domain-containing protein [Metschnikowia bicuspidata]